MRFATFTDPPAYLQRVQDVLGRHEALNSVILSIARRLASGQTQAGVTAEPFLCLVEDEQRVLGAAVRTPPHNLVVGQIGNPIAVAVIADALARQRMELPGVYAPIEAVETFVRAWSKLSRQRIRPGITTRIYEARRMVMPAPISGVIRPARAEEKDALVAWAEAFAREAHLTGPSPSATVQLAMEEQRLFVWDDGGAVAMAARGHSTPSGVRINAVYTPPENRRRGYASMLVAQLCRQLLDSGLKMVSLNADVSNATSNAIYQRIGFEPVGDAREYSFSSH